MPNLSAHLGIAEEVIVKLDHPVLNKYPGACLLGSVSPDIRIITKTKRDETHFVELDFDDVGQGLDGLFTKHPELRDSSKLNDETSSFIIGYACHLFADESWIVDMYRPYFGNRAVIEDKIEADLMDRALQLHLDSQEHVRLGGTISLKDRFRGADKGVRVGFITEDKLSEWCDWVQGALAWEFDWERLRFMSRRVDTKGDKELEKRLANMVDKFLQSIPNGLDRIHSFVPKEKVEGFRLNCIQNVMNFAGEYLN